MSQAIGRLIFAIGINVFGFALVVLQHGLVVFSDEPLSQLIPAAHRASERREICLQPTDPAKPVPLNNTSPFGA